ncbi:RNA binding motif protein 12Ba [Synchiropus picturatus]
MTTILRLKGLDETAEIQDVRRFFQGLSIPEGGVCIVGGKCSEAFIAFSSQMDAELALAHSGNLLRGSEVSLRISSLAELEHKLKAFLRKKNKLKCPENGSNPSKLAKYRLKCHTKRPKDSKPATTGLASEPVVISSVPPAVNPQMCQEPNALPSNLQTAFLLGIYTVLKGQSVLKEDSPQEVGSLNDKDFLQAVSIPSPGSEALPQAVSNVSCVVTQKPGYIRMFGVPALTTKEELETFFEGLHVEEAMMNVKLGHRIGCLVKFANELDADNAHLFNQNSLVSSNVEIRTASEKIWRQVLENGGSGLEEASPMELGPLRENLDYRHKAKSDYKRRALHPQLSKKPKLEQKVEYIVQVTNLPKDMTKTQIKELFGCPDIGYKQVLLLFDKTGARTDVVFLILRNEDDYSYAINLNGCHLQSGIIKVVPATRDLIKEAISKNYCANIHQTKRHLGQKGFTVGKAEKRDSEEKTFLFVRNMPQDVQKSDVKTFFQDYELKDNHIVLLHSHDGSGTGEAVVQFTSAQQAATAHKLLNRDFCGNKLLMTPISAQLREDIIS